MINKTIKDQSSARRKCKCKWPLFIWIWEGTHASLLVIHINEAPRSGSALFKLPTYKTWSTLRQLCSQPKDCKSSKNAYNCRILTKVCTETHKATRGDASWVAVTKVVVASVQWKCAVLIWESAPCDLCSKSLQYLWCTSTMIKIEKLRSITVSQRKKNTVLTLN